MVISGAEPFFIPGGRTGVLLVHGFTGVAAELRLLGEVLSHAGYTVLAVRLAGHGTSPEDMARMGAEDWLDSARDGYALLSGCCDRIVVCGHSMGAVLTLLLAAEKPVEGAIFLSAPIFIAQEQGVEHLPPREYCDGVYVPKARRKLKNVPQGVNDTYRKMPLVCVHELLSLVKRAREAVPRVKVPALILHGLQDHTASPESAIYLEKYLGSAEKRLVWLENAGHMIPVCDGREQVFREALGFLHKLNGTN